eukprot:NODE_364_length_8749_cov_0.472254.p3 type:complete len:448 gc:universal NODE_364_length_8749_cov_0.472254:7053-8396(+)
MSATTNHCLQSYKSHSLIELIISMFFFAVFSIGVSMNGQFVILIGLSGCCLQILEYKFFFRVRKYNHQMQEVNKMSRATLGSKMVTIKSNTSPQNISEFEPFKLQQSDSQREVATDLKSECQEPIKMPNSFKSDKPTYEPTIGQSNQFLTHSKDKTVISEIGSSLKFVMDNDNCQTAPDSNPEIPKKVVFNFNELSSKAVPHPNNDSLFNPTTFNFADRRTKPFNIKNDNEPSKPASNNIQNSNTSSQIKLTKSASGCEGKAGLENSTSFSFYNSSNPRTFAFPTFEITPSSEIYNTITAQKPFNNISLEELRAEHYQMTNKCRKKSNDSIFPFTSSNSQDRLKNSIDSQASEPEVRETYISNTLYRWFLKIQTSIFYCVDWYDGLSNKKRKEAQLDAILALSIWLMFIGWWREWFIFAGVSIFMTWAYLVSFEFNKTYKNVRVKDN